MNGNPRSSTQLTRRSSRTSLTRHATSSKPSAMSATSIRSEEHTSELHHSSISYAVFCLKKKIKPTPPVEPLRRPEDHVVTGPLRVYSVPHRPRALGLHHRRDATRSLALTAYDGGLLVHPL